MSGPPLLFRSWRHPHSFRRDLYGTFTLVSCIFEGPLDPPKRQLTKKTERWASFLLLFLRLDKRLAKFTYLQVHNVERGHHHAIRRDARLPNNQVTQHCIHAAIWRSFKVSFKLGEPNTSQRGFSDIARRTIAKKWRLYMRLKR